MQRWGGHARSWVNGGEGGEHVRRRVNDGEGGGKALTQILRSKKPQKKIWGKKDKQICKGILCEATRT